jgi:F-box and leucine-rich repeat protein 14
MLQHCNLSSAKCDKQRNFLSALAMLQNLHLNVQRSVMCYGVAHLNAQTALQHFDLSWCKRVTDRVTAHPSGLILLQHLDLSFCHDHDQRRLKDIETCN